MFIIEWVLFNMGIYNIYVMCVCIYLIRVDIDLSFMVEWCISFGGVL